MNRSLSHLLKSFFSHRLHQHTSQQSDTTTSASVDTPRPIHLTRLLLSSTMMSKIRSCYKPGPAVVGYRTISNLPPSPILDRLPLFFFSHHQPCLRRSLTLVGCAIMRKHILFTSISSQTPSVLFGVTLSQHIQSTSSHQHYRHISGICKCFFYVLMHHQIAVADYVSRLSRLLRRKVKITSL
jgi:hypothetical protein